MRRDLDPAAVATYRTLLLILAQCSNQFVVVLTQPVCLQPGTPCFEVGVVKGTRSSWCHCTVHAFCCGACSHYKGTACSSRCCYLLMRQA